MKILVPVKRVIDYNVKPRVKPDGTGIDLANVKEGKEILANSGLPIVAANDLGDAARKIVAQVKVAA